MLLLLLVSTIHTQEVIAYGGELPTTECRIVYAKLSGEKQKSYIQCIPRKVAKYHQSERNEQIKKTLIVTIQHILDYLEIVYLQ